MHLALILLLSIAQGVNLQSAAIRQNNVLVQAVHAGGAASQQAAPSPSTPGAPVQTAATKPAAASAPAIGAEELQALVKKQFGGEFEVMPKYPAVIGDFNGDGVQDIAVVVRSEHPLKDAAEFGFLPLSPQDEYFGYGDVRHAVQTEYERWQERKLILVVHGVGASAWRAEKPAGKFLIINVPFDDLSVTKVKLKKRMVDALDAHEADILSSTVYWDARGKKYRWQPGDTPEDGDLR